MRLQALLIGVSLLAGEGDPPAYTAHRTSTAIVVDGKLDDPAWKNAPTLTFVFPWEKQSGAKQLTTARLLWDDNFLYVGYDCQDADITARLDKHDDPTYRDDAVELFINPKPSQSGYIGIEMNALGTLYDYFMIPGQVHLKQFDLRGVLVRTHLEGTLNSSGDKDRGWSLELAIPWSNFDGFTNELPPKPGTRWTANLNRWDGTEPNRRLSQWSDAKLERPNPHNPARFGSLIFEK